MSRTGNPSGAAGFTLVEVLISLVILSTGIVLVLQALDTSVVALAESRDTLWASLLLRETLDDVDAFRARHGKALPSASRGTFSGRYANFAWEREVRDAVGPGGGRLDSGDAGELKDVIVTVWRTGSDRTYTAATRFHVPEDAE